MSDNETTFLVQISSDHQQTWVNASALIFRNAAESLSTGGVLTATVNIVYGYDTYFRVIAANSMRSKSSNILLLAIDKANKIKKSNMYIIDIPTLLTEDEFIIRSEDNSSIYL